MIQPCILNECLKKESCSTRIFRQAEHCGAEVVNPFQRAKKVQTKANRSWEVSAKVQTIVARVPRMLTWSAKLWMVSYSGYDLQINVLFP